MSLTLNRIKVVSEVAELVPILRAVDSEVKSAVFKEVTTNWQTAKQIEDKYGAAGLDALRFFEKMKLVETKWQTGAGSAPEKAYHAFYSSRTITAPGPVKETSDALHGARMADADYEGIEKGIFERVVPEGKFSGEVADALKAPKTMLKPRVKRAPRLDFRGHRIIRFED